MKKIKKINNTSAPENFLTGGGEMGDRIRSFDWSKTSLGSMAEWSASLKTAVNIVLQSPVPLVMLWGSDGIMIYNDAYSVFAGARHPFLLGSKVVEGWPEVAEFNRNVMKQGLAGKISYKDQTLTLYRNNIPEQVSMNLNYSPIMDENGKPAGVLAIVVETTLRVQAEQKQKQAEAALQCERKRLQILLKQAPAAIAVVTGEEHVYEMANLLYQKVFNRSEKQLLGKTIPEVFPEIAGQGIYKLFDTVFQSGEPFTANEFPATFDRLGDGIFETGYFNFVLQPIRGNKNKIDRILIHAFEVTEQVIARKKIEDSEERFRAVIENSADAIALINKDGKFTFVSPPATEILGYTPGELLGRDTLFLFPKGHLEEVQDKFARVLQSPGTTVSVEHKYVHKDGSIRWLESRITNLLDKPNINSLVSNFRDITDSKLTVEKLQESESQFRTLANAIPQVVYIADGEGTPFFYNERWYLYTGLPEDLQSLEWTSIIHPDDLSLINQNYALAKKHGDVFSAEYRMKSANGSYRWFLGRSVPIRNDKGTIVLWFGTATDIHDLKEAQAAFRESEARKISFFETALDAIITMDAKGRVIEFNPAAEQIFGYTRDEAIGKEVASLIIPSEFQNRHRQGLANYLKTGKGRIMGKRVQIVAMRKDKTVFPVELTITQVPSGGSPIFTGTIQDITKRKQLEDNLWFLAEASKLFSSSLDLPTIYKALTSLAVPHIADWCAVDMLNDQGVFDIVAIAHKNPKKVKLVREFRVANPIDMSAKFGLPEVVRTKKSEFIPVITEEMTVAAARTQRDLKIIKNLGMTSAISTPLIVRSKAIGAITFVTSDSHRRLTESELGVAEELAHRASLAIENASLYTEAQKAIILRDEFIGVASHELKTPVTSIKAYTQIMESRFRKTEDSTSIELARKMDTQLDKLTHLIGDLLEVTKIQGGKLQFNEGFFDYNELVKEIVEEMDRTTNKHTIITEYDKTKIVYGDRDRIGQVITNLLSNAIKYSPHAEKIIVKTKAGKNKITLCVQDFGLGIAKEDQPKLFERFFRASGEKQATYPGLGLGLYISAEIIKRHNGKMEVESEKGKGSTFCFSLPLQRESQ